jgi:uncharacterized delta-60 repeat protein
MKRSERRASLPHVGRRLALEILDDRRLLAAGKLVGTLALDESEKDDTPLVVSQGDGRLLALEEDGTLSRYLANGDLDFEFGSHGVLAVANGVSRHAVSVTWLPDGSIVVFGGDDPTESQFLLKLDERGERDLAFGDGGEVLLDLYPGRESGSRVLPVGDGGMLLNSYNILVRLTADGRRDGDFGDSGIVRLPFHNNGVATDSFGRLLVSEYSTSDTVHDFVIWRYTATGEVDTSFGDDGVVRLDFGGAHERVTSILVQSDDRIVVVGSGSLDIDYFSDSILAVRLHPDGTQDLSFGTEGLTTIYCGTGEYGGAIDAVLLPNDKIVVMGYRVYTGFWISPPRWWQNRDRIVSLLDQNGLRDANFAGEGWNGQLDRAERIAELANGGYLISGNAGHVSPNGQPLYERPYVQFFSGDDSAPRADILLDSGVAENSAAGVVVGVLNVAGETFGSNPTYTLLESAGGRFRLEGANLVVARDDALDFEAAPRYTVRVRAVDDLGRSLARDVAVDLEDVNEAPQQVYFGTEERARFVPLGDLERGDFSSWAWDVTDDGVVVGRGKPYAQVSGFIWDQQQGMRELDLQVAKAINDDGKWIVGTTWTSTGSGGMPALLGPQGVRTLSTYKGEAVGISADGKTVVGNVSGPTFRHPFVWSELAGFVQLPLWDESDSTFANAVSADGSAIVGEAAGNGGNQAVVWRNGEIQGLGDLEGGKYYSAARGVSADGRVVVGQAQSALGTEAFRWTAETGLVSLGDAPGAGYGSAARAISSDGQIIVGDGNGQVDGAFTWDVQHGLRQLRDYLQTELGVPANGWQLNFVGGVSPDGQRIVGAGTNRDGKTEAWMAVIPREGPRGSVAENAPVGTAVGTLDADDPDAGDALLYSLTDSADGRFALQGRQIVVARDKALDFEQAATHTVRVRVTDRAGLSIERDLTITVVDVVEPPNQILLSSTQVEENSPAGSVVGVLGADIGANGLNFTLLGDVGGPFEIVGNELRVKSSAGLDFEAQREFVVRIAAGGAGETVEAAFTINVVNVNERPTIVAPADLLAAPGATSVIPGIQVDDPDLVGGDALSKPLRMTLDVDQGAISLGATEGLELIPDTGGALVVEGTLYALNAALSTLTYQAPPSGSATLSLLLNDLGNVGNGPVLTAEKAVAISVQSPPLAQDDAYTVAAGRTLRAASYAKAVLDSAPLAYWRLDDAAGQSVVRDEMGAHPGVARPGAAFAAAGALSDPSNRAVTIGTADASILIEDAAAFQAPTSGFTIESWIYPESAPPWQRIASTRQGPAAGWGFGLVDQRLVFTTFGVKDYFINEVVVPLGRWTHVAAVYDDSYDVTFYVNGERAGVVEWALPLNPATGPLVLGDYPDDKIQPWTGSLDEVAFYNRTLSPDDIQRHYLASQTDRTLLANDSVSPGALLTAVLVAGPQHGTLDLQADGSFRYRPNAGFFGSDEFSYAASNGGWLSAPAKVRIDVVPMPGDFDLDGEVDLTDFGLLKDHFGTGTTRAQGDFNGDGRVDLNDFGILKAHFGEVSGDEEMVADIAAARAKLLRGRA